MPNKGDEPKTKKGSSEYRQARDDLSFFSGLSLCEALEQHWRWWGFKTNRVRMCLQVSQVEDFTSILLLN